MTIDFTKMYPKPPEYIDITSHAYEAGLEHGIADPINIHLVIPYEPLTLEYWYYKAGETDGVLEAQNRVKKGFMAPD